MLKTFRIRNFLSISDKTYSFSEINYINEEGLKAFFILKFLVTLSEQKPELVSLINNEMRPNPLNPISFEINLDYHGCDYFYEIAINENKIIYEFLKIDSLEVFKRTLQGIILNNETITWNCPNQDHKVFLDACAVNDQKNNDFLYFFKENIFGLSKFIKNPLDDDINKLFNHSYSSISPLIKNILICDEYFDYDEGFEKLNLILKKYDLNLKNDFEIFDFLKLNINLTWLVNIGGGILFLDSKYLSYKSYLINYQIVNECLQIIFLN